MATKKFIIEVEEGVSKCSTCPLDRMDGGCHYLLEIMFNTTCNHINLATMKIKEYNVPDCYDLQCEARKPKLNIELEEEK